MSSKARPFFILLFLFQGIISHSQELSHHQKKEYKKGLKNIYKNDQHYRQKMVKRPELNNDSIWRKQSMLDSINKIEFRNLIEEYGYPSSHRLKVQNPIGPVLHFTNEEDFGELKGLFWEELQKGNMPAEEYAWWYDRCQRNMKKQIYFGQYTNEQFCGYRLGIYNDRRKKIGLGELRPSNNCSHPIKDSSFYHYNTIISEIPRHLQNRSYERIIALYDSAFTYIKHVPYDYFQAFCMAINDSNYTKANSYLIEGTKNGLNISHFSKREINLYNKTPLATNYYESKDSLMEIHYNSIDREYHDQLFNLREKDQEFRDGSQKMYEQDSLNFEELILMSETKGFPTFKNTGYGSNCAYMVLWHQRDNYPSSNQWKRILPLIEKKIEEGELNPGFFYQFDNFYYELGVDNAPN